MAGDEPLQGALGCAGVARAIDEEIGDSVAVDESGDRFRIIGRRRQGLPTGQPVHLASLPRQDRPGSRRLLRDPRAGGVEGGLLALLRTGAVGHDPIG
jgi:hypothetical protein